MNELEIQALGMSRSGNHAIANWIFRQAEAPKLLLNCAEGKTDPFLSARPLMTGGPVWRAVDAAGRADLAHRSRSRRLLYHSYEDSWLAHAFSDKLERHHDAWLGPSRRRVRLLVLRDPFNLFASRLRMGAALSPHVSRRMWKQHARAALGRGRKVPDLVVVLYNRWCREPAYRAALARALGLSPCDAGLDEVAATAGGSSFDGLLYDGRAGQMPTGDRWRAYADDSEWAALIDDEMCTLSEDLFGPAPWQAPDRAALG
ncbi:hypothetical protein [Roseivivax isoporae]|uniref:Sulfotransferase family protein n=1 Tax=Roseivivax isoporae LMG 25204 TaxID=1449351 RepID=X7FAD9_9RHOB|nr:hypothetical protein [Roseivivax isoporae]ETX29014.1 hypothetical protein RISW2_03475 [Roseivivax isoporae LMG 25204]